MNDDLKAKVAFLEQQVEIACRIATLALDGLAQINDTTRSLEGVALISKVAKNSGFDPVTLGHTARKVLEWHDGAD